MSKKIKDIKEYSPNDISDEDIFQAMAEMSGYVDITPEDFKEIYTHAYEHAHIKISSKKTSSLIRHATLADGKKLHFSPTENWDAPSYLPVPVKKYFPR